MTNPKSVSADLDAMFSELVHGPWDSTDKGLWNPPVDLFETKDGYWLTADLPGVQPKDIKLGVMGSNTVLLYGIRSHPSPAETGQFLLCERDWRHFHRKIDLGSAVNLGAAQIQCKDGIYRLFLPKLNVSAEPFPGDNHG